MGRKKIDEKLKKGKLSITISSENFDIMTENKMNKSKLINWLLDNYFNNKK